MPTTYLVTGNAHKLASFQRLLTERLHFEAVDIDLPEIQSFDPQIIIKDKVERAYEAVGKPVIVEDVSAGIDDLNGLPGPFIKFFEQQLGKDALYQLLGDRPAAATVISTLGYYDGSKLIVTQGFVKGQIVAARGDHGFGFDCCFMPNGQPKTYAEMTDSEKDTISHRSLSVAALLSELKQL